MESGSSEGTLVKAPTALDVTEADLDPSQADSVVAGYDRALGFVRADRRENARQIVSTARSTRRGEIKSLLIAAGRLPDPSVKA